MKTLTVVRILPVSGDESMPKPRIQSRVDQSQKDRIEAYAEAHDMTQAEAVRYLTYRGLDYEAGELAAADGGEVLDRVEALQQNQRREKRRAKRRKTAEQFLLGVGVAVGFAALFGAVDAPLGLLLGLAVGLALIGTALWPVLSGEASADE
jgi:hypothetical protein